MRKILLIILLVLAFATPLIAATIDLNWTEVTTACDGSAETVVLYTIWWGDQQKPPLSMPYIDNGGVCNYSGYAVWQYPNSQTFMGPPGVLIVPDSESSQYLYMSITATDNAGNVSVYSDEIQIHVPPTMIPPAAPANLVGVVR